METPETSGMGDTVVGTAEPTRKATVSVLKPVFHDVEEIVPSEKVEKGTLSNTSEVSTGIAGLIRLGLNLVPKLVMDTILEIPPPFQVGMKLMGLTKIEERSAVAPEYAGPKVVLSLNRRSPNAVEVRAGVSVVGEIGPPRPVVSTAPWIRTAVSPGTPPGVKSMKRSA